MSEHRGRRRFSRSIKVAVCATVATLLGVFVFTGTALADEEAERDSRAPQSSSAESSSARPKPSTSRSAVPANIVKGTPCTKEAVACVSLGAQKAWLFKDGKIAYGPVKVSTGGPNRETPIGDHVVQWKHKDHKSQEFRTPKGEPAPMNFAVFFAEGGVAFHEGTLNTPSAGCVRLVRKDAEYFFNYLQLGDKVEVRG